MRDNLEIGDLREAGKDFILNAIGEVGVGFVIAQVLEGKDGDTLCRNVAYVSGAIGRRFSCVREAKQRDRQSYGGEPYRNRDEFTSGMPRDGLARINVFGALDSLRCNLESPRAK